MGSTAQHLESKLRRLTPVSAPADQREDVAALSRLLGGVAHARRRPARSCSLAGPDGKYIPIPESVFYVLERVTEVLARGDAVTIVPVGKELTTQQAADLLNVSRQYLVRLLEEGKVPYTKLRKHRRLRIEDVLAFRDKRAKERKAKLDALAEFSEEAGGYPELE